jgi:septal ring factor EnvC (AmiA/AmiB activator)
MHENPHFLMSFQGMASIVRRKVFVWHSSNVYNCLQSSTEHVMEKRVDEMGQELRKLEARNSAISKDLHNKEQAVTQAQKECEYLKTKLHELERALTESDQSTRQMEEKLKVSHLFLYNF